MGLRDLCRRPPRPDLAEFEREGLLHREVARGSITYRRSWRADTRSASVPALIEWMRSGAWR
jgi:hypothetical protein